MPEGLLGASWDGSVVLDIGADVGALMLQTSESMKGREIELVPENPRLARVHSAVRERVAGGEVSFAAVYPQLHEGEYRIEGTTQRLRVDGGRVTVTTLADAETSEGAGTGTSLNRVPHLPRDTEPNRLEESRDDESRDIVRTWRTSRRRA